MNHLTHNLDQALNDQQRLKLPVIPVCELCLDNIFGEVHEVEHEGKEVTVCTWCMNHKNDDNN